MKKIRFIILFFIVIFFCCGCNGNVTRSIRHSGFTINSGKFICKDFIPNKENTQKKVKYFTSSFVVDENGEIYDLSLGQVFSNEENCKKSDTDLVVSAIFDDQVIRAMDGNFYYLLDSDNNKAYTLVPEGDNNYNVCKLLLSDSNVLKVVTVNQNSGSYYVLKNDGNVYNYIISKSTSGVPSSIVGISIVYNKNNYGGKINNFNEAGNSITTYIETDSEIYRKQIVNKEECSKYADIGCEYELKLDENLTKYKDKILFYNGSSLITTYQKQFTVSS